MTDKMPPQAPDGSGPGGQRLPDPQVGPPTTPPVLPTSGVTGARVPSGRAADPVADRSVRPAVADDAAIIGRIHSRTLATALAAAAGEELAGSVELPADSFAEQWRAAIAVSAPGHHVLVATDGGALVGFAALAAPAGDEPVDRPTLEIIALEVDPGAGRTGHGSRLLAACTDLAGQDGADVVRAWSLAGEEARERFLTTAGFAPSGTRRILQVGEREVTQVGWHVALSEA